MCLWVVRSISYRDRISLLRALVKDLFLATSVLLLRLYLPIASSKIHNTNTTKLILTCISLLSHFSRVWLCATPSMAAHQAPLSLGFSLSKNTGVGCHFLLQCSKVKSESEVAQSCRTPSDPMDCSLPGSSVHGIFQARVLEWGAIAFSTFWSYVYIKHFRM